MSWRNFAVASLLVPQLGAAAELRVRLSAAPNATACLARAAVVARPADGGDAIRVQAPADVPAVSLQLDETRGRYNIQAVAAGCWSETVDSSTAEQGEIVITMHAAGTVTGTLVPDRSRWPATIEVRAFPAPSARADSLPAVESGHPLDCAFDRPSWTCAVPAGVPLDLRLMPQGFATVHYWDVVARPNEKRALEPRELHVGASVSGWIEDAAGKPLTEARVALTPSAHAAGEQKRAAVRERTARTNARGFFQLSGVAAGEYRLVARAEKLSPAVLPVVNVREGENLFWPRTIVLMPFATLELQLTPPLNPGGKPWQISVGEVVPVDPELSAPVRHRADTDGLWEARDLRADSYRIVVEDEGGDVVERLTVDLSRSGATFIPLTVQRTTMRGVLRFGDTPLKAEIRFGHQTGRSVRVSTDELGQFTVAFPAAGMWRPTVFPKGPRGPQIVAEPVTIKENDDATDIEIVLAGGRIRGAVLNAGSTGERAAVHVARGGALVAQQLTGDDGTFDFIGFAAGDYTVDAEAQSGTAPTQTISLEDGATIDLTLRLESAGTVEAFVETPHGAPASGALVRISVDGGHSWSDLHTDVHGHFSYSVPGTSPVQVIVLTHSYPASFSQLLPAAEAFTLRLQPAGGKLRTRFRAFVSRGGPLAPLQMFYVPPSPLGIYDGAVYLEPGVYTVCAAPIPNSACQTVTVNPQSDIVLSPPKNPKEKAHETPASTSADGRGPVYGISRPGR